MNLLTPIIVAARWLWVIAAILTAIPIGAAALALAGVGACLFKACTWLMLDNPWLVRTRPAHGRGNRTPLVVTGPGGEYRRPSFPAPGHPAPGSDPAPATSSR
jgi:hypothetical protein